MNETRKYGSCYALQLGGHQTHASHFSTLTEMPVSDSKSVNLSVTVLQRFQCCHVTLTIKKRTCGVSAVMWSSSVPNFSAVG